MQLNSSEYYFFVSSVKPKISYDSTLSQGISAKATSKLSIDVSVEGVPKPRVTWHLADAPASSVADVSEEAQNGDCRLVMASAKVSMSGKVKVVAENSVGSDEAVFDLVVKGTCMC